MQRLVRFVRLIAMAALLAACGKSEWQPLQVGEGGFKVLMRPEPNYLKQQLQTPAGPMIAHLYSSDRPLSYYAVGYSDYPLALVIGEDPQNIFSGVRDTWVRRLSGRLVTSDGKLTLAGKYPGLEFTAEGRAKGADAYVQARLFLVDQRLYQVVAMGLKNQVPQGEVNRFLNSFELVPVTEPSRIGIRPGEK